MMLIPGNDVMIDEADVVKGEGARTSPKSQAPETTKCPPLGKPPTNLVRVSSVMI